MREMGELFAALGRSSFRRRFQLKQRDAAYLARRGLPQVLAHRARIHREPPGPSPAHGRRPTDADGRPSDLRCAARHRDLLPQMSGALARHPPRSGTQGVRNRLRPGGPGALARAARASKLHRRGRKAAAFVLGRTVSGPFRTGDRPRRPLLFCGLSAYDFRGLARDSPDAHLAASTGGRVCHAPCGGVPRRL